MNILPNIPVTITNRDRTAVVSFRVFTEEEKAECERASRNAEHVTLCTEVDGSGRRFETVRADHAKVYERELVSWEN